MRRFGRAGFQPRPSETPIRLFPAALYVSLDEDYWHGPYRCCAASVHSATSGWGLIHTDKQITRTQPEAPMPSGPLLAGKCARKSFASLRLRRYDPARDAGTPGEICNHGRALNLTGCKRQGGSASPAAKPTARNRPFNWGRRSCRPNGARHPPLFGEPNNRLSGKTTRAMESRLLFTSRLRIIGGPSAGTISQNHRGDSLADPFLRP